MLLCQSLVSGLVTAKVVYHRSHGSLSALRCCKHGIPQSIVFEASFGSCSTSAGNVTPHIEVVTHFSIRSCGLQTKAYQPGQCLPRALPRYRITCAELHSISHVPRLVYALLQAAHLSLTQLVERRMFGMHPAKTVSIG